jgi:hypothetical protein
MTYSLNHNFFSQLTPQSMYWAGFIASDGNIAKDKPRITVALKSNDINHLQKFKENISFDGPIHNIIQIDKRENFKTGKYYKSQIRFTSHQITKDLLNNFLITPNKSKTLQFPNHLLNHPLLHHFIRGLIDGDGGIYYRFEDRRKENICNVFLCGTDNMIKSVQNIFLHKLNANGTYYLNKNNLSNIVYRNLKSVQSIINYLYQSDTDVCLERKYLTSRQILTIKPKKIQINIEEIKNLIKEGNTLREISKTYNCSISTICRRLSIDGALPSLPPL